MLEGLGGLVSGLKALHVRLATLTLQREWAKDVVESLATGIEGRVTPPGSL